MELPDADIGGRIHWDGDEYRNVDMPGLSLVRLGFSQPVPTQGMAWAPFGPDVTADVDRVVTISADGTL